MLAGLSLLGLVICILFVETVPPKDMTATTMHMLRRRVMRFAQSHDKLPERLSDTAVIEGFGESLTDGWGHDIEFTTSPSGVVRFKSLGRDHKEGGTGLDIDIVRDFPARQTDGQWSDEFVDWNYDSLRPNRT